MKNKAFTLIELLVVITIILILAGLVYSFFSPDRGQDYIDAPVELQY